VDKEQLVRQLGASYGTRAEGARRARRHVAATRVLADPALLFISGSKVVYICSRLSHYLLTAYHTLGLSAPLSILDEGYEALAQTAASHLMKASCRRRCSGSARPARQITHAARCFPIHVSRTTIMALLSMLPYLPYCHCSGRALSEQEHSGSLCA
jgi:hypothetical protein